MMIAFWSMLIAFLCLGIGVIIWPLRKIALRHKSYFTLLVCILILLPSGTLTLYVKLGNSIGLANYYHVKQQQKLVKQALKQFKTPSEIIVKMQEHLRKDPGSARGWYLLGRLYASSQQFIKAKHAFAKAYQLEPNNFASLLQYAQAVFLTDHQQLTDTSRQLIQQILAKNPNHPVALNMLAVAAYNGKDYAVAVRYWEKLLPMFPQGSQDNQIVLQAIAKAQQAMGKNTKSLPQSPVLTVHVNIAEKLKSQIHSEDLLMVYAKAINGPPMPLAAVRRKASHFPVTVTLSNANAMLPQMTLSQFAKVRVYARLSPSGSAMPHKGDLVGQSQVISTAVRDGQSITIQINQEVS